MLGADDRERVGVEQADLREQRGLVPVDVLVRDLPVAEADDDGEGELDPATRRSNARQQRGHLDVVREAQHELVDDLRPLPTVRETGITSMSAGQWPMKYVS